MDEPIFHIVVTMNSDKDSFELPLAVRGLRSSSIVSIFEILIQVVSQI